MPSSKLPSRRPRLVETEQHLQVRLGHRASIGATGDRRHDPPGARELSRRVIRTADEKAAAARRVSRSGGAVRPADGHAPHVRRAGRVGGIDVAAQQRLSDRADLRGRLPEERHGDGAGSGLDRQPHLQRRVGVHRVRQRRLPRRPPRGLPRRLVGAIAHLERVRPRLCPADGEQLDTLAVQADLQFVRLPQPANRIDDRSQQAHAEDVLAVEGKPVAHGDAAARAEGQAVEVVVLREHRRHEIGRDARTDRVAADGQPADAPGRPEVPLKQQRRHAQRVGDVVEPVARVVRRQQGRDIHVQREQVPDGVGVLGAVEAVKDGGPWKIGPRRPGRIEVGFGVAPGTHRASPSPDAAGRPAAWPPARSLRTTFSQVSASRPTSFRSSVSRVSPTARSCAASGEAAPPRPLHDALVVAGHAVAVEQFARRSGMLAGRPTGVLRVTGVLLRVAGVLQWAAGSLESRRGRQKRQPAGGQDAQADRPGSPRRRRPPRRRRACTGSPRRGRPRRQRGVPASPAGHRLRSTRLGQVAVHHVHPARRHEALDAGDPNRAVEASSRSL